MRKYSLNNDDIGNLKRDYDIIKGAIDNDVNEVEKAVLIDGTSVNYQEIHGGLTALHKSAARGNFAVVEWLADHAEIDFHTKDNFGRIAFDLAVKFDRQEIIDFLGPLTYPDTLGELEETSPTSICKIIPFKG